MLWRFESEEDAKPWELIYGSAKEDLWKYVRLFARAGTAEREGDGKGEME